MEGSLLFVVCLALFIIQIVILVKSIKKKEKKYWIIIFCLEIIPIILLRGLLYYYDYLAPRNSFMPGLQYLGEELTCLGATIVYFVMFCITMIAWIIVFEKKQKLKNKKSESPLKLITAFVFIMVGFVFLVNEVTDNFGKVETIGTVIDFEEIRSGGDIEYWPIIQYNAEGQELEENYPMSNVEIGDKVKIYYSVYNNDNISRYLTNNKIIWIPTILIGILIILFRFKDDFIKITKQNG